MRIVYLSLLLALIALALIGLSAMPPVAAQDPTATPAAAATIRPVPTLPPHLASSIVWHAEYFNNIELKGSPVLVRSEFTPNYDWGFGSPLPGVVDNAYFSARWTRTVYLEDGIWLFKVWADDGVRLYIDYRLVIDAWYSQKLNTYTWYLWLAGGNHTLRLEYFELEGTARVGLEWQKLHEPHELRVLFSADRLTINEGECVTLWWDAEPTQSRDGAPAQSVLFMGLPVEKTGSYESCPAQTARYSLEVIIDDQFSEWYDVTVEVIPSDDPFPVSFGVDRTSIRRGECVGIAWSTHNARRVYLEGRPVELSGGRTECPIASEIYRLRVVKNNWTIEERAITVYVTP
ncbi:MAG: hypothetical protein JXB47_19820 [Anaerolineae bacterium]|nr:hypothetical protein [Anaerolineae bacterium]